MCTDFLKMCTDSLKMCTDYLKLCTDFLKLCTDYLKMWIDFFDSQTPRRVAPLRRSKVFRKYPKSDPKVTQKWPKSSPKVIQKWPKCLPKVTQKWPKSDLCSIPQHPISTTTSLLSLGSCVFFVCFPVFRFFRPPEKPKTQTITTNIIISSHHTLISNKTNEHDW